MTQRASFPKAAILASIAAAGVLAAVVYLGHDRPAAAPAIASASAATMAQIDAAGAPSSAAPAANASASSSATASTQATRTKEQAAAALMALPELRAWSAQLEKNSDGKIHGAVIEDDPAPRTVKGKRYWQFSFVENSPEAALRWESFLVSSSDDEILVEDVNTDELLTLERWRKEKQPSKRNSAGG